MSLGVLGIRRLYFSIARLALMACRRSYGNRAYHKTDFVTQFYCKVEVEGSIPILITPQ